MELAIGHAGLSEADSHRLRTVLGMIMISSAAFRRKWIFTEPDRANLVVTNANSDEGRALLADTLSDDGRVLALLAGEADDVPGDCLRLPWPIRMEDLIVLLRRSEKMLGEVEQQEKKPVTGEAGGGLVQLASLLRGSDDNGSNTAWKVSGVSERSIYISPGQKVFFFGKSLIALRNIEAGVQVSFTPVPVEDIQGKPGKKPLTMLQWLVGMQTGSSGLLPWIKPDLALRLRRYPAFNILHHSPSDRRIAAVMTQPRGSVEAIAKTARVEVDRATAFVNAASLCGYLIQVERRPVKKSDVPGRRKTSASLLGKFRKALGMESTHV